MPAALTLSPETLVAFFAALTATAKVTVLGLAGYFLIWKRYIAPESLAALSSVIANLTLPCLIFQRFSAQFDPQTLPNWWLIALAGTALTLGQIGLGLLLARRIPVDKGRDEYVMMLGFQNAGFFVLPMLQSLLPAQEFGRGVVLLFVFIIFFNGALWPVGQRVLLKERGFNWRRFILSPPTLWTIIALVAFGLFHNLTLPLRDTMLWEILLGGKTPGAIQLIGDLTVPFATIILGASIAQTAHLGEHGFTNKRGAINVNIWKLVLLPLLGFLIIHFWPTPLFEHDRALRLLVMLEFCVPVSVNVSVFCQQYGYEMKLIPAASLLSYAACILTVPFWVALVL